MSLLLNSTVIAQRQSWQHINRWVCLCPNKFCRCVYLSKQTVDFSLAIPALLREMSSPGVRVEVCSMDRNIFLGLQKIRCPPFNYPISSFLIPNSSSNLWIIINIFRNTRKMSSSLQNALVLWSLQFYHYKLMHQSLVKMNWASTDVLRIPTEGCKILLNRHAIDRIMPPPHRYAHPHPQNLWMCYLTWQQGLCWCD